MNSEPNAGADVPDEVLQQFAELGLAIATTAVEQILAEVEKHPILKGKQQECYAALFAGISVILRALPPVANEKSPGFLASKPAAFFMKEWTASVVEGVTNQEVNVLGILAVPTGE